MQDEMMEVSYKRDTEKNYMIIESGNISVDNYKVQMICNNNIPALNQTLVKQFNNDVRFCYDISGKIAMSNEYAVTKMRAADIRNYVIGIQKVMESVKQYMLDIDKIILDLDFVYLKQTDKAPVFCYYPDKEEEFYKSLQRAFDKIIELADHSDRETVIMSYGLQQLKAGENNVTITDIIRFINECKQGVIADEEKDNFSMAYNETKEDYLCEKETIYGENESKRASNTKNKDGFNIIRQLIKDGVWGNKFFQVKKLVVEKGTFKKIRESFDVAVDKYQKHQRYQTEEDLIAEEVQIYGENNYTEMYEEDSNETILLQSGATQLGIVLKCTDLECPQTIIPNEYPCIVGKSKKSADYIIDDNTISRVHMRLHEEAEGYFVEDLNSSNGTFLNEEKLVPHELKKINIGDTIRLAEMEYVVC